MNLIKSISLATALLMIALASNAFAELPQFGASFWAAWGDGQAELCAYDLRAPRYGQNNAGTAITIFVTETFLDGARVKADSAAGDKRFAVMKLNMIKDFSTGIYDYNTMLSTFVALEPHNGRKPGSPTKVSFGSQEWCGHVYHQLLFDQRSIREQFNSYFEGEADQNNSLEYPADGVSEDQLFHWARGFGGPVIAPGQQSTIPLLTALHIARFSHVPTVWSHVTLSVDSKTQRTTVPAGEFETRAFTAVGQAPNQRMWQFDVETAAPHRIIKWTCSNGESAELIGSKRMKYWQHQATSKKMLLEQIGLKPRPARTP